MHDNIVKLHEYTESEEQFVLFMEYCNDAEYFDNKIVEVSTRKSRIRWLNRSKTLQINVSMIHLMGA